MTALDRYELLEAEGIYEEEPGADPVSVILTFGSRSLTIMGSGDVALSHWPLASLHAIGPAEGGGLLLAPGAGSPERLRLDDAEMIAALREVCPELDAPPPPAPSPPRRRWLRNLLIFALLAALVFTGEPWLRGLAVSQIPPARMEAYLDRAASLAMADFADAPRCTGAEGHGALKALARRLSTTPGAYHLGVGTARDPGPMPEFIVVKHKSTAALALPGNRVIVPEGLIAAAASPEEAAAAIGHALAQAELRVSETLLKADLTWGRALGLLFGDGPPDVAPETEARLTAQRTADAALIDRIVLGMLDRAGLPTGALPDYLDRTGEAARATESRAAATPTPEAFTPALSDRDWVALEGICE